jgi:tripartite-type tricarboxylate transporter receptor subunit TctC
MRFARLMSSIAVALMLPFAASAQDYPQRQVTIVVPFGAGGSVDIVGRLVAQKLTERLGKPFIVENRPGAGTATATTAVAKSAPDGHTLLFAPSGTFAINPTLYKQLAYDPLKDLTMVALVTRDPLVLVVNPSLPVNSIADLVKYAKENPKKVSFASTGPGTSLTLLGELLKFTAVSIASPSGIAVERKACRTWSQARCR